MLRGYLQRAALQSIKQVKHFVIGNSSADFDTVFGSIIMAFFLTQSTQQMHLFLIDCHKDELSHRFEIMEVFKRMKIDPSLFNYKDALAAIPPGSSFSLYDHNVRAEVTNVEYIVDHHDHNHPQAKKYLIAHMGSVLTHLYYLLFPEQLKLIEIQSESEKGYVDLFMEFTKEGPFLPVEMDQQSRLEIEEMIRYGIQLDTFNFDLNQKDRWTIFDQKAVQAIELNQNYKIGYDYLTQLKFDESLNKNLSLSGALKKDYKQFNYEPLTIEYSIIYLRPDVFYQHYQQSLQAWLNNGGSTGDVYMLMSVFKDTQEGGNSEAKKGEGEQLKRELMFVVAPQSQQYLSIIEAFLKKNQMELIRTEGVWHFWKDPAGTISRKVFDKEFRKYYKKAEEL